MGPDGDDAMFEAMIQHLPLSAVLAFAEARAAVREIPAAPVAYPALPAQEAPVSSCPATLRSPRGHVEAA
jgi:hypothetical protein